MKMTLKPVDYLRENKNKCKAFSPNALKNVLCDTNLLFYQLTSRSGEALIL